MISKTASPGLDVGDFIERSVRETEIATINYCLKLLEKYPAELVKDSLARFLVELKHEQGMLEVVNE